MKLRSHSLRGRWNDFRQQRGVVAILVGLSMLTLLGAGGLALDTSRLYVNKSELQTAADACALAAAEALICTGTSCQATARDRGLYAANRNSSDFQAGAVGNASVDVTFSLTYVPIASYASAGAAPNASRFARCLVASGGITPWLMGVVGIGTQTVTAQAVASNLPGGSLCPDVPIGMCPTPLAGGSYAAGDWVVFSHDNTAANTYGGAVKGTYRWIDYTPPMGGAPEVAEALTTSTFCGVKSGDTVGQPGAITSLTSAYNTRFGIYANGGGPNAYTESNAPPDRTGFSYPTVSGATSTIGASMFSNYMTHFDATDAFQGKFTGGGGGGGNGGGNGQNGNLYNGAAISQGNSPIQGRVSTRQQLQQYGVSRRVVTAPVLSDCNSVGGSKTIAGWACFLMLNPMGNGANTDVFLEYRGMANTPGSPCVTAGLPGGPGSTGGFVPTLVQ
jgi:Flp pilus assembly protein TadG